MNEDNTSKIIAKNLKRLMDDRELSNVELSEIIGVSESTVGKWLLEKSIPRMGAIEKLASYFHINKSDLLEDRSNAKEIKLDIEPRKIPILGKIAAGTPILAVENHEDYFDTSEFINADFALQIQGDSMIGSRIYDGDIVFLKKQPYIENGQIGAFLIDGEATLKIFNKQNNTVMLLSSNPNYSPIILSPDRENLILGKLIGVYSRR